MLRTIGDNYPPEMTSERETANLPTPEHRAARHEQTQSFLTILVAHVTDGSLRNSEDVTALYREFQQDRSSCGNDFSLANVWGIAWEQDLQNTSLAKNHPEAIPAEVEHLSKVVKLLEEIIFKDEE